MGLFKSKAEKEQERKMQVRKSMKELEKRIGKLKEQETKYVQMAQIAMREELPDQIKLAKEALKLTISERKRTYKMLLNAQIMSQMKDMSTMTNEFLHSMQVISKDIAGTTTSDMNKIARDIQLAIDRVSAQTDAFSDMLEDSQDNMSDFSEGSALVSDEDVDKLIYGGSQAAADLDSSIDSELAQLKKHLSD